MTGNKIRNWKTYIDLEIAFGGLDSHLMHTYVSLSLSDCSTDRPGLILEGQKINIFSEDIYGSAKGVYKLISMCSLMFL